MWFNLCAAGALVAATELKTPLVAASTGPKITEADHCDALKSCTGAADCKVRQFLCALQVDLAPEILADINEQIKPGIGWKTRAAIGGIPTFKTVELSRFALESVTAADPVTTGVRQFQVELKQLSVSVRLVFEMQDTDGKAASKECRLRARVRPMSVSTGIKVTMDANGYPKDADVICNIPKKALRLEEEKWDQAGGRACRMAKALSLNSILGMVEVGLDISKAICESVRTQAKTEMAPLFATFKTMLVKEVKIDEFPGAETMVDWESVPITKWVDGVVNQQLGMDRINKVLGVILPDSEQQPALFDKFQPELSPLLDQLKEIPMNGTKNESLGNISISFFDPVLTGLDTFGAIYAPERGYMKLKHFADKYPRSHLNPDVRVATQLDNVVFKGGLGIDVSPEVGSDLATRTTIQVEIDNLNFAMDVRAAVKPPTKNGLESFFLLSNPCIVSHVGTHGVRLQRFLMDYDAMKITVKPEDSSCVKTGLGVLECDIAVLATQAIQWGFEAFPVVALQGMLYSMNHVIRGKMNDVFDAQLDAMEKSVADSKATCSYPDVENPMSDTFFLVLQLLIGGAIAIYFVAWIVADPLLAQARARELEMNPTGGGYVIPGLDCLAMHPSVPGRFGLTLPVFIVANIVLFIYSNVSLGAVAVGSLESPVQDPVVTPPLFMFTLESSIREMWEGGVYALMLLVLIFSGIFPYVKLMLLFYCCVSPQRYLSVTSRGRILRTVDMLGKWSLVDTYVMVLFMVGFGVTFPIGGASFRVVVLPKFGFYCFVMATVFSMVAGHVCLGYHEAICGSEHANTCMRLDAVGTVMGVAQRFPRSIGLGGNKRQAALSRGHTRMRTRTMTAAGGAAGSRRRGLSMHVMDNLAVGEGSESRKSKFGLRSDVLLVTITVGVMAAVLIGMFLPLITFTYTGMAGQVLQYADAIGLGKGETVKEMSLHSIGMMLPAALPGGVSDRYIRALQITYYSLAVGVVLLFLTIILLIISLPIYSTFRKTLLTLTHTVQAWASLEVLIISVVAAVSQIQMFTGFMVGQKCDLIDAVLRSQVLNIPVDPTAVAASARQAVLQTEALKHGHVCTECTTKLCFGVEPSFNSGTYILALAAIVAMPVGLVVVNALEKVTRKLEEKEVQLDEDEEVSSLEMANIGPTSMVSFGGAAIVEESPRPFPELAAPLTG